MPTRLLVQVEARLENLGLIGSAIRGIAREVLHDDEAAAGVELAVVEASSNVIRHGHPSSPSHVFTLLVERRGATLTITIDDEGPAFDFGRAAMPSVDVPASDLPTGGFGLALIHELVDQVEFERTGGVNRLRLVKRARTRPGVDFSGI